MLHAPDRSPRTFKKSLRPTSSSTVRTPSFAMYSRSSSAIKRMKFSTYSGFPAKRLRSSGFWVCNTCRTGIQITYTHHDTAHGYQRAICKNKLFRAKTCAQWPRLYHSSAFRLSQFLLFITQSVHNQCLMRLCQTKFPRKTCVVDGTAWRSTCTTVISGDQDNLCTGFLQHRLLRYRHLPRKPVLRKFLHRGLHSLSQKISCSKILDGINIVMWWRGDQRYTRCEGSLVPGNPWICYFLPGRCPPSQALLCMPFLIWISCAWSDNGW